jgi:hypothetical protein
MEAARRSAATATIGRSQAAGVLAPRRRRRRRHKGLLLQAPLKTRRLRIRTAKQGRRRLVLLAIPPRVSLETVKEGNAIALFNRRVHRLVSLMAQAGACCVYFI